MRLTNEIRAKLVAAILADVPTVDYEQKLRTATLKAAEALLPPAVKRLWNSDDRQYIAHETVYVTLRRNRDAPHYRKWFGVSVPGAPSTDSLDADVKVAEFAAALVVQQDTREKLEDELRLNFAAFTNSDKFAERFPEFARYLPATAKPVDNLPATTALIDGLRAAGWPAQEAAA